MFRGVKVEGNERCSYSTFFFFFFLNPKLDKSKTIPISAFNKRSIAHTKCKAKMNKGAKF